eukprot:5815434-Pyramimonas_sp.AAC.1
MSGSVLRRSRETSNWRWRVWQRLCDDSVRRLMIMSLRFAGARGRASALARSLPTRRARGADWL